MAVNIMAGYQAGSSGFVELMNVPRVRLYVERASRDNWFVHVGHVTDRGRWRTGAHVHPGYGQVIFVRNGSGVMYLDGRNVPFNGPCALVIPPDYVHALDYEVDVDRWAITIEAAYLSQVNVKLHAFIALWSAPVVVPMGEGVGDGADVYRLIRRLKQEVEEDQLGHAVGVEALLTTVLLKLVRQADLEQADADGSVRHDVRLVDRFRKFIDQHYREHLQLADYAAMLAVSLVQLRTACASAGESSPTKMIHARLITEAKRTLIFSDMSVEQIAFGLGFSDAAYFTRFFRREVGQTPSQFRAMAR